MDISRKDCHYNTMLNSNSGLWCIVINGSVLQLVVRTFYHKTLGHEYIMKLQIKISFTLSTEILYKCFSKILMHATSIVFLLKILSISFCHIAHIRVKFASEFFCVIHHKTWHTHGQTPFEILWYYAAFVCSVVI